jgi:rod shape-determining protein MreD
MKLRARREQWTDLGYLLLLSAGVVAARVWFGNFALDSGVRIDVALLVLPALSIARGAAFGAAAGFLLGLLVDATHAGWMGASSVAYALVGFCSGSFGQTMYVDRTAARGILVAGSVIIFDLIFGLLAGGVAQPFWRHAAGTLGSALLTGLIAAAITVGVKYLRARLQTSGDAPVDA